MLLRSGAGSGGGHGRYRSQCCARYPKLSIIHHGAVNDCDELAWREGEYIILCTHTYDTTYLPVEYDTIGIVEYLST